MSCGTIYPPFTQNPADGRVKRKKKKKKSKLLKPLYLAWQKDPTCYWCKKKTHAPHSKKKPKHLNATRDHVFTREERKNLMMETKGKWVLACRRCNSQRSNAPFEQWKLAMGMIEMPPTH